MLRKIIEWLYFRQKGNLALYDRLSGLYNYNWLSYIGFKKYKNKELWITLIDINDFKKINDKFGHLYGNKLLVIVSDFLKKLYKYDKSTSIVRFGGDEFIIITEINLCEIVDFSNYSIISFGTFKKEKEDDLRAIINHADEIMYENKKNKKPICLEKLPLEL